MTLLAVPNVSEGHGRIVEAAVGAITRAHGIVRDTHTDADHNRTVFTLSITDERPLVALAEVAAREIDLRLELGLHPHVGALDVAPIVWRCSDERGHALATALVLADRLGTEVGLPVFLYGELAGGRTRASLRRGGVAELRRRVCDGELKPDFGPHQVDPAVGATLVAARPPLVAFNAELAPPASLDDARAVATAIREGGADGLPGVRAIGLWLTNRDRAQVSMNLEDHGRASPADALAAIERYAPVEECELIGLAPRAAFAGFPIDRIAVRNLRFLEDLT